MRFFAVVSLLGASCVGGDDTPPPPLANPCAPVVLAPAVDATDWERAAVEDAAGMWASVATVHIGVGGPIDGAATIPIRFASAPLAFLGAYEVERGDLVINSDIPDEATRAIAVAHEVGHAFGLVHVSGRSSVMNAGNATVVPDPLDGADLMARWDGCAGKR